MSLVTSSIITQASGIEVQPELAWFYKMEKSHNLAHLTQCSYWSTTWGLGNESHRNVF